MSNIVNFKKDLEGLINLGDSLLISMEFECYPDFFKKKFKSKYEKIKKKLKIFKNYYQAWYSESLVLIVQLLPDRVNDFKKYYEKPKSRKKLEYGNYVIEDYLQNIVSKNRFGEVIVDPAAAINQFEQQLNILKSVQKRFESSLFDIKQLTLADVFDSELDSAKELNKKGFFRGAGAISGVVIEKHLSQVCKNHKVTLRKKNPSISDFNDSLKKAGIYQTPTWRKIQHLGDLRNLCDHNKTKEPKKEDVEELIEGVEKIIKTIF